MAECALPNISVRRPAFLFRKYQGSATDDHHETTPYLVAGRTRHSGQGDGLEPPTPYLVESFSSDTPPSSSSASTPDCEMMTCEVAVDEASPHLPEYKTPIVGYEVMEERARFTVFKVRVEHHHSGRNWFVYRRYTDFVRLNKKLRETFPGLRFTLPPKRWFGSNFDPLFLEDRLLGLQAFVDSIMPHRDISRSEPVRSFFCLDEPPGPEDSIEESWARCESLEEVVCQLQSILKDRTQEVELLKAEVSMLRSQQQALLKSLKVERAVTDAVASNSFTDQLHINAITDDYCRTTEAQHVVLLEDRSNGDGSTGSRERIPPVGDSTSLNGELSESVCISVRDGFVDSSTPIKKVQSSRMHNLS